MEDLQDIRRIRGIDIAKRYTLKQVNGVWLVPSSSGKSKRYKVSLKPQKCTCPDFEFHNRSHLKNSLIKFTDGRT